MAKHDTENILVTRRVIDEIFSHPPVNDAEFRQRLGPLSATGARRALVERLQEGLVKEQDISLYIAAFEILGIGKEGDSLLKILKQRQGDMRIQALALAVLADEVPEKLTAALDTFTVQELEQLNSLPLTDLMALIQADPMQAETVTYLLKCTPAEMRSYIFNQIERCRKRAGTSAAGTYLHALCNEALHPLHSQMIEEIVEEGGAAGIALLERLKENTKDPTQSREIQKGLLLIRTRAIDPSHHLKAPIGQAYIGSCDGQGAFILLGIFENPNETTTMADLCIRAAADIRDGFVIPRYCREDLTAFMEEIRSSSGSEFTAISLAEAAEIVAESVQRSQRMGYSIPEDALASIALFERARQKEAPKAKRIRKARSISQTKVKKLLKRREYYSSWFFDMGDLTGVGLEEPPRHEEAQTFWITTASAKLDREPMRLRLETMARYMANWHAWRGESELASLCAALANGVERDFQQSALVNAMLWRTVEVFSTHVTKEVADTTLEATRYFGDSEIRQHLKSLFFKKVRAPKGRHLAQLDFSEAALSCLDNVMNTLPGEIRPREDERYQMAFSLGKAFVDIVLNESERAIEYYVPPVTQALMKTSRLSEAFCQQIVSLVLPDLLEFLIEICPRCHVACLERLRHNMADVFFALYHPIEYNAQGKPISNELEEPPAKEILKNNVRPYSSDATQSWEPIHLGCKSGVFVKRPSKKWPQIPASTLMNKATEVQPSNCDEPRLAESKTPAVSDFLSLSQSEKTQIGNDGPRNLCGMKKIGDKKQRQGLDKHPQVDAKQLKSQVLAFLKRHPRTGSKKIIEALNLPNRSFFRRIMQELLEAGEVTREGQRSRTVYSTISKPKEH